MHLATRQPWRELVGPRTRRRSPTHRAGDKPARVLTHLMRTHAQGPRVVFSALWCYHSVVSGSFRLLLAFLGDIPRTLSLQIPLCPFSADLPLYPTEKAEAIPRDLPTGPRPPPLLKGIAPASFESCSWPSTFPTPHLPVSAPLHRKPLKNHHLHSLSPVLPLLHPLQ